MSASVFKFRWTSHLSVFSPPLLFCNITRGSKVHFTSSFSQQSTLQCTKHLTMDFTSNSMDPHPLFNRWALLSSRSGSGSEQISKWLYSYFPSHQTLQTFVLFGEKTNKRVATNVPKNWQYTIATDHKNLTVYDNRHFSIFNSPLIWR